MPEEIINRVQRSGIVTIDLEELYPKGERVVFDIAPHLWQGMVLKEKDFREFVENHDWSQYQDCFVALQCSVDAIVPTWAYMLLAAVLEPFVVKVSFGTKEELEQILFEEVISNLDIEEMKDRRVVIKGCSKLPVPLSAYVSLTERLKPVVKAIMFGEPCSTVPIYRKPRK